MVFWIVGEGFIDEEFFSWLSEPYFKSCLERWLGSYFNGRKEDYYVQIRHPRLLVDDLATFFTLALHLFSPLQSGEEWYTFAFGPVQM